MYLLKKRGVERLENLEIDLEQFIAIKGISAMGNQLTKEKVLEINTLEPLPYQKPKPIEINDINVVDAQNVGSQKPSNNYESKSIT